MLNFVLMTSSKNQELNQFEGKHYLVLFDGVCNLCNSTVQFVIRRDKSRQFKFASLTWPIAERVAEEFPQIKGFDSILVYSSGKVYDRSSAALKIAGGLGGLWPLMGVFWIIPKFLRDAVYQFIARNRYKWFGKKDYCMMPSPDTADRFMPAK